MPDLERAAKLVAIFGLVWEAATPEERKQVVHTLFEAVYLDSGSSGPPVAVEPKAELATLFGMMNEGWRSNAGTWLQAAGDVSNTTERLAYPHIQPRVATGATAGVR